MAVLKCPNCGLLNPDGAVRCDCGYDFPSSQVRESYLSRDELEASPSARGRASRKAFWQNATGLVIVVVARSITQAFGWKVPFDTWIWLTLLAFVLIVLHVRRKAKTAHH